MLSGLFTACDSRVITNTEPLPLETFDNTTFTTGENGEREEPANTEDDIIGETFPVLDGVTRELTTDDYVVYYTDKTLGDSRLNEIVAYNRKTGEMIDVFASQVNLAVKPSDEYFTGQTFLTDDFYFGDDGLLYLTMLTDYNIDGFHKKLFYSKDLITLQSYELGSEISDTPYPEYMPEKGITKSLQMGNYLIYRYEYTEKVNVHNYIVSGIGYIDTRDMSRHTVMELENRDPESYNDSMDAMFESNPPRLIPDGFAIYENKLYYYLYSNWSDENWAELYDLPADNGWHMRTILEYNFETMTNNFGMWQDSDTPLPLKPEFTDPPSKGFDPPLSNVPPTDYSSDAEYMAAANSAFYGQFAFDDEYIYYENINDNHNLYKKRFNSDDAGVKLADANVYGHIYGICVSGDEVFFVTKYYDPKTATGTDGGGSTAYSVKKDGSSTEPRVVAEGVGDYFYVYEDIIYYTGGISSLNEAQLLAMPVSGGTPEKIADFAMHMSIAEGLITYHDGKNIFSYDIASKDTAVHIGIDNINAIDSIFRYKDYILYHYNGDIAVYDINLGSYWLVDYSGSPSSIMPMSYNIFEGMLYYNTFSDKRDDGYYAKNTYGYSLTEKKIGYQGLEESRAPYLTNPPECVMFSTPNGLYTYGTDGSLEKYIFPSL
jgi:hypothetical protein